MAKIKLVKYPKKPKANASVASMEAYLNKCKAIDKRNGEIKSTNAKVDKLRKQIQALKQKF